MFLVNTSTRFLVKMTDLYIYVCSIFLLFLESLISIYIRIECWLGILRLTYLPYLKGKNKYNHLIRKL